MAHPRRMLKRTGGDRTGYQGCGFGHMAGSNIFQEGASTGFTCCFAFEDM